MAGLAIWWLLRKLALLLKASTFRHELITDALLFAAAFAIAAGFWLTDSYEEAGLLHPLAAIMAALQLIPFGAFFVKRAHAPWIGHPEEGQPDDVSVGVGIRGLSAGMFAVWLALYAVMGGFAVQSLMEQGLHQSFAWLGRPCPIEIAGTPIECLTIPFSLP